MKILKTPGRRRGTSGFTLIELLVATVLSSVVLIGMFSILTSMVTAEVNGMRTDTVNAWSLAGINVMNTDIAGAGAIGYPASGGAADSLVVCTNWSTRTAPAAVVDATKGNSVYSYCWDTVDAAPYKNSILRNITPHAGVGTAACPGVPLSPCTSAVYGGDSIVATGVYKDPANDNVFTTDANTMNAMRIRLVVGNPNGAAVSAGGNNGTVTPVPVSVLFNTEIILED